MASWATSESRSERKESSVVSTFVCWERFWRAQSLLGLSLYLTLLQDFSLRENSVSSQTLLREGWRLPPEVEEYDMYYLYLIYYWYEGNLSNKLPSVSWLLIHSFPSTQEGHWLLKPKCYLPLAEQPVVSWINECVSPIWSKLIILRSLGTFWRPRTACCSTVSCLMSVQRTLESELAASKTSSLPHQGGYKPLNWQVYDSPRFLRFSPSLCQIKTPGTSSERKFQSARKGFPNTPKHGFTLPNLKDGKVTPSRCPSCCKYSSHSEDDKRMFRTWQCITVARIPEGVINTIKNYGTSVKHKLMLEH